MSAVEGGEHGFGRRYRAHDLGVDVHAVRRMAMHDVKSRTRQHSPRSARRACNVDASVDFPALEVRSNDHEPATINRA